MIVSITINSMRAERDEKLLGKVNVKSNPRVRDVKKGKIESIGKDALEIDFGYTATYSGEKKDVAKIEIEGKMFFLTDEIDKIVKDWKKKKTLPEEVLIPVMNSILRKSLSRAVWLAEELQLPPPIRFPVIHK